MRLLTFCPTKNRPDRLQRMLESWDRTHSDGSEMFVYVSHEDPQLERYKEVLAGRQYMVGEKPRCLVEIVNHVACELFPGEKYYQCINDDHFIHTQGYDNVLINAIERKGDGWGIAFGRALVNEENWHKFRHPSAEIISGNIVRTLKYFCTPMVKHIGADTFVRDIGEGINRFFYEKSVIIEHEHFVNGKADFADYAEHYAPDVMEKAGTAYRQYVMHHLHRDIDALRFEMEDPAYIEIVKRYKFPDGYGPGHPDWYNPGKSATKQKFFRYVEMVRKNEGRIDNRSDVQPS